MSSTLQILGRTLKRVQHRHHRLLDSRLSVIGTTLVQWDALKAIKRHPLSSSHDLAVATFQTDQAFGTLASRLVDRGLIERVAGPGRSVLHSLTPAGEDMLRLGHGVVNEVLAVSFAALSGADRKTLHALLLKTLGEDGPATDAG